MMASAYETFWRFARYAVVGHSSARPFPREGDPAYADFAALPGEIDAVVVEVPREETRDWVQKAVDAGIKDVWLHMNTDSPEAVALAGEHGLRLRTGTCAVMYVRRGFSPHAIHGFIRKVLGRY